MNTARRKGWKQRILRYRKAVHGYVLYVMMVALFLWFLPVISFSFWGKNQYFVIIGIVTVLFILCVLSYLTFTKHEIVDKPAWFMLILILPFFGAFVFWFISVSERRPKIYSKKSEVDETLLKEINEQDQLALPQDLNLMRNLAPYSQFTMNNKQQFLTGEAVYKAMLADMLRAAHHIHLEIYIVRYDETTTPLFNALVKKAEQGVEVRLLLDVFGTLMFRDKMFDQLLDAGIEIVFFNQQTRQFLDHSHVNHRKHLIIDGEVAYTGGFNFGAEYVQGYPKKNLKWCDVMTRIEGDLVASVQLMFLLDWAFSLNADVKWFLKNREYFPQKIVSPEGSGAITQFIADGPDREGLPLKDTLRALIQQAKKRIYFTTPYLIPPDDVLTDLKLAALAGVDVRIIIPGVPDKRIVYYSTESHLESLLKVGVRIYKMSGHFVHSKLYIFDDMTTMYGTANVDMRSFFLNLEENVVQYHDRAFNEQAMVLFEAMLKSSKELSYATWRKRSLRQKKLEQIFNILHPLF